MGQPVATPCFDADAIPGRHLFASSSYGDAYEITSDARMVLKAERAGVPPTVKLDDSFKFVDKMAAMVPNGPPSLIKCKKITVE